MNIIEHMRRVMAFSKSNWGPGERTAGICHHIEKELREIKEGPDNDRRSEEWVDIVKLGLDGLWRALLAEGWAWDEIPDRIAIMLCSKQSVNEQRNWPDWRNMPVDKAIEHVQPEKSENGGKMMSKKLPERVWVCDEREIGGVLTVDDLERESQYQYDLEAEYIRADLYYELRARLKQIVQLHNIRDFEFLDAPSNMKDESDDWVLRLHGVECDE